MKYLRMFGLLAIIAVVVVSGCTAQGTPTYAPAEGSKQGGEVASSQPQPTTVQTLEIGLVMGKSWDADAEVDGIEFMLAPRDRDDMLVKTSGTITAKLYESGYDASYNKVKGDLIQEWTLPITEKDFDSFMGARIRMEYKSGFTPAKMDTGWLEITFTTPDGKSFSAKEDSVFLAGL